MPVKWDDLLLAFEFVSFEPQLIEHRAWVCRTSGRIFIWDSDTSDPLEEEDEDEDEDEDEEDKDDKDDGEEEAEPSDAETGIDTDSADADDKLPADILDETKYLPVPGKRDLDLGSHLVFDFVREHLPRDYDEVRRIFSRRGAYSKFKDLLARQNAVEGWYDFESRATEKALREWCELNSIEIEEPEPRQQQKKR
jgi:hypothetical protein